MTECSFRTEIIWPELPPLSPEQEQAAQKLAHAIEAQMLGWMAPHVEAARQLIPERCCNGTVLHHPSCRFWSVAS